MELSGVIVSDDEAMVMRGYGRWLVVDYRFHQGAAEDATNESPFYVEATMGRDGEGTDG